MLIHKSLAIAALAVVMAWPCGASARNAGVVGNDDTTYVAAIEVVQHDADAPAEFADALRDEMLKEAAYYGTTGRPIVLKIDLDDVHFKNVAAAMIIGDDNRTKGHVTVVDQAGGEPLGTFAVRVDSSKPADIAAEIGLDVVGAFDPTGAVDIAHMAGDASSAEIDRAGTITRMVTNFAEEALRETFGDARAKLARRAEAAAPPAAQPH